MMDWIPSRDAREPFLVPDGRTVLIKYTFVVSPDRPVIGHYGHFQPNDQKVLWQDRREQRCTLFGGGHKALDFAREQSALLPAGPKRDKAYEDYLSARKFLWRDMIGRVVSVAGSNDPQNIWVVGVEETSTTDFEIMLDQCK